MFHLFKDPADQETFERDGFVKLSLLGPDEVEQLRSYYLDISDGGNVQNSAYGMYISIDGKDDSVKSHTIDLVREVAFPRLKKFVHDCKPHLGSYLVKVPGPGAYTYPHQDWTFIDNDRMDHYFSITVWIALGHYTRETGTIGFVKGSHRFFENVNCSPSPATKTPTQGLEPLLFNYLSFPEMQPGDALAFNNKTIHAALPNQGDEQRVAIGIGLTPVEADLYHYFLKPGTKDRMLKLKVEKDFFLHYNNDILHGLWEAGKIPDYCSVAAELPVELGTLSEEELEKLCVEAGNERTEVELSR